MKGPISLSSLRRRSFAHTVQDGLGDIALAVVFLIGAAAVTHVTLLILTPFVVLLGPRALEKLRARYSYPRAGYVELPQESGKRTAWGMPAYVIAAFAVVAAVMLVADDPTQASSWRRWSPLLAALLVGGGIHYTASRSGLPRYYVTQAVSLVSGIMLSVANRDRTYRAASVYCIVMAAWCFLMGAAVFLRFLRKHAVPASAEVSDAR